ncbi:MAG: hypothetical protein J2P58_02060 [Acidimicrobiaceae bacterium]|nr:hypothetical protein [Acidimicrobiaceae bacterium]
MAGNRTSGSELEIDTGQFVAAAVLIGVGGLLLFIGFIVGCLHALSEGTRLVSRMETPPNELAKANVNRLSAAAKAGAEAWKGYTGSGAGSAES